MNQTKFLIPTLFSILLLGCTPVTQIPTQEETLPSQPTTEIPNAKTTEPLSQQEADALITAMIKAINEKNATFFLPYLLERDQNIENVEVALNHYETYFKGKEITDFELFNIEELGQTGELIPIKRFSYRLSSPGGTTKEVEVYQEQTTRLIDPFLLYSFHADDLVKRYTEAIKSQNLEQISQIFNYEIEQFNAQELKSVLEKYSDSLSLDSLNYRFTGLNSKQQYFTYTLFGNDGKEHEIKVIYGDGLVGIRDDFLPVQN